MNKKELMVKAHKLTKEMKKEYPTVNYKFQLGLCMSYLLNKGDNEMVELKGTVKQIEWAESIREKMMEGIETLDNFILFYDGVKNTKCQNILEQTKEFKNKILTQDSCKWFIENREKENNILSSRYCGTRINVTCLVEEKYTKLAAKMENNFFDTTKNSYR